MDKQTAGLAGHADTGSEGDGLLPEDIAALFDTSSQWIWETDAELRFSRLPENYEAITGIAPGKVLGRFRFDFLQQASKGSRAAAAHLEDLEARRPFRDFIYELKGGRDDCRWVSTTGFPRFDAEGAFVGYRGIARNVTAMASQLDALKATRSGLGAGEDILAGESHAERMMAALNIMSDAFCYYDRNDKLILYNEAMLDLHRGLADKIRPGVSYGHLLDAGIERQLWDLDGADPQEWRRQALERRKVPHWQSTVRTADGRWIMHREMRTEDGGVIGISTNVTELKKREADLARLSEQRGQVLFDLDRTIDAMQMGIVLLDADLNAEIINQAFYDIWKVTHADVDVGSPFRALMDVNRHNGIYDVADDNWEAYVAQRLDEIRAGSIAPREFRRADGCTMIYSVTTLSGGKRLVCYYDITEMKGREAEIAAANERTAELFDNLKIMVDSMPIGVVVVDPSLKTEIVNHAFYDFWQIDPRKCPVGSSFSELMEASRDIDALGDDDQEWQAHVSRREAEIGAGLESARQMPRADGRTLICSMAPLSGGRRLLSYLDITEVKSRETELAAALERARLADAVINGVKDPIFVKDDELKFVFINEAFAAMFKTTPEQMLGKTGGDFVSASDAAFFEESERQVLDTGITYEVEENFEFSGIGRSRIVRKNKVSIGGGKDYVACFIFDITELKRRETEAEKARRHLANVLESLPAGVIIYDSSDRFVLANRHLQETLPALKPVWQQGFNFREAIELGHSVGYFRASGDPALDALYDSDPKAWVKGYMARHQARNVVYERRNPDGRWFQVYDTRVGDGTFVGVRVDITELKRREAELEEARRQLADVLESMPAGVIIYDKDDRFVLANRKLKDSLPALEPVWTPGRPLKEILRVAHAAGYDRDSGDAGLDALYERDSEAWVDGFAQRYHVNHSVSERRNQDGNWFQVSNKRTADGTFIGVRVDITELKQREKALRESMRQTDLFRHVMDDLPVAAFIKAEDLTIEFVNKAWCAITGIAKDEAIGKTDRELFPADDADGYMECDTQVSISGDVLKTEEEVVHRDGTVRQLMTRKSRLVAIDGSVHLVGSSADITEMKAREEKLRETLRDNEVFQSLIDNLPVAIYAKKPDLRLTYVNKGWCALTGYSRAEAVGKTDAEIFGHDGETFMEDDRAVLRTGETREIDEALTLPDGSIRYQFARKGSFLASDGTVYLIGSTFDVTEQKEREQELREAQQRAILADRAKSEFLANMSHEIRTPMNGVLGMAELLAKSELDPKQKTFTDIIVKSGNALLTIINDILDFSKIDAGQLVLDPAPFNLAEAIEDVATLVSTRAKEKDLELIVRFAPELQDLYVGDVGRIRQIITNLLGNAVKFTESGHVLVDVAGAKSGDVADLRISVTDTGIGIPADKLQLVFEKFSQVDGTSTRRHEGTGLGLAITSRLVHLMGGEIGVDSVEGKGSTFWVTLSLPHAARPAGRRLMPVDVSGSRILVVDDNAVNRAILKEQMASWTFDACAAESGAEGLKVLQAAAAYGIPVDCIVLDYQMPGMTGAEMARAVRAMPSVGTTPIVMLTSVDQSLSNVNYRDLNIDAQLIKPARSSALLEALVGAIQKHRVVESRRAEEEAPAVPAAKPVEIAAPAQRPAAASAAAPAAADMPHRLDILVAEDNEVNQLVFTQILGETKLAFQIVSNGRKALEAFRAIKPRMILMDVSMPEMNGLEATAAIRRLEAEQGGHVPIIGVTAHALKGDRERCLEAGMDDYLPKPISPKALLDKVDRWAWREDGDRRDTA